MTSSLLYDVLPPARLDPLRLAAAAYLARYKGQSRIHTECDLRAYLRWCAERAVDPLNTSRPYLELYVRWMQEDRNYAPSTVSRRLSTVAGFYRTCVIDGLLEHSPAEHVAPPTGYHAVADAGAQSPAVRGDAQHRTSILKPKRLRAGLPARATRVAHHGSHRPRHRRPRRRARPPRRPSTRRRHRGGARPDATRRRRRRRPRRRGRTEGPILLNREGRRMQRHSATRRLRQLQKIAGLRIARMHPHMLRHTYVTTMLDAGVDLRDTQIAARHADPRTTMRYDRARTNLDRHPNYILAALHELSDLVRC
jgi:integrase/recombinase XerD